MRAGASAPPTAPHGPVLTEKHTSRPGTPATSQRPPTPVGGRRGGRGGAGGDTHVAEVRGPRGTAGRNAVGGRAEGPGTDTEEERRAARETGSHGGRARGRRGGGPPRKGPGTRTGHRENDAGIPPPRATQGGPREARDAGRPSANDPPEPLRPPPTHGPAPQPPGATTRDPAPRGRAVLFLLQPSIHPPPPGVRTRGPRPARGTPRATGRARLRTVPTQRAAGCGSGRGRKAGKRDTRRGRGWGKGGALPTPSSPSPPSPTHARGEREPRVRPPAQACQSDNSTPAPETPARPDGTLPQTRRGGRRGPRLGKRRRAPPGPTERRRGPVPHPTEQGRRC